MRDEVRAALDGLVAALQAHAEAAVAGTRPDIPDPLPQANDDLGAAVAEYRQVVEHWTGALVPLEAPEPPVGGPADDEEPMRVDVVGRWTYEVPSVARLLAHASERAGDRPEAALYELLRRRGHPLRGVAPDLVVRDRAVAAVFAADDGSYVELPVREALQPPRGAPLYAWADLPATTTGRGGETPPHIDDVDWAGDAERWR